MIKSRIAMAGGLLAVAGSAYADFSVTPTLTSDYDFRGVTQTLEDPAIQLGLNYNHESGFYAGLWGSNVDFGPGKPNIEIDAFAGFAGGDAAETFGQHWSNGLSDCFHEARAERAARNLARVEVI